MTSNLSFQRLLFCALLENLVANNVAVILRFFAVVAFCNSCSQAKNCLENLLKRVPPVDSLFLPSLLDDYYFHIKQSHHWFVYAFLYLMSKLLFN